MATVREWKEEFEDLSEIDLDALIACLDGMKETSPLLWKEFDGLGPVKMIAAGVLREKRELVIFSPYWRVSVVRTSYATSDIIVRAQNEEEAQKYALALAEEGHSVFVEGDTVYDTDGAVRTL